MGCVLSKWCCWGGPGAVAEGELAKMGHFDGDCEKIRVTKETASCVPAVCPDQDLFKAVSYTEERSLHARHSVLQVMDRVMERCYNFDLTYITEKIISVFFPPVMEEQQYQANLKEVSTMLKSKHQDNFLIFNLSEKRHDITHLNPKVNDFAWPDQHAPQLDKIIAICRAMETWLTSDPQHVVVLYCKGDKGKTGVIIAAYMQYSISARADKLLSTIAMKKFCEDKLSSFLHPSQNRYVYYFGGLVSGTIQLNSKPLFLHQVLIPNLTNFQACRGYFPFLKIYESMKLVYTSGVYNPQSSTAQNVCVTIEPALQLQGDIMVKCYHWHSREGRTDTIFRLQFHTGTIHSAQLWFGKDELDEACVDNHFPSDAKVEFVFSSGPEKFKEQNYQKNDPKVTVEYSTGPLVRWDSYKNFNLRHQDSMEDISHTRGPIDGSLYAQVKKRRGPGLSTVFSVNGSPVGRGEQRPSQHLQKVLSPTEHLHDPPWPPAHMGKKEQESLEGSPMGRNKKATKEKEDKETAILDDTKTGPQECTEAVRVSCWSQSYKKPVCEAPVCLPNVCCLDRCDSSVFRPLPPITPYSSPKVSQNPPTPYLHHNGHSHLSLSWHPHRCYSECSLPHLYPYGSCDAPISPHAHTLPATSRLLCGVEECMSYHHPSHGHQLCSHLCQFPNRYLQPVLTGGPVPTRCCSQWDKSAQAFGSIPNKQLNQREVVHWRGEAEIHRRNIQREESHLEQQGDTNIYWNREAELYQGTGWRRSEETTLPSEEEKDVEIQMETEETFWHQTATASLLLRHPVYPESSCSQSNSRSHSYLDSSSSGYQTPQKPCPSSPYQPSSSESQGYTSGYQSDSTSPLPTCSENFITSIQYTGIPSTLNAQWAVPETHSSPFPPADRPVHLPGGAGYSLGHLTPKDAQVNHSATLLVSRPHSPDHTSCPHAQRIGDTRLIISEDNFIPGLCSYQSKECKDSEFQTSCIQLQEIQHHIQNRVSCAPEIPESHTSQTALIDPNVSLSHHDASTVIAHANSIVVEESLEEPPAEVEVTTPQQPDIQSGPSSILCPETTCTGLGSIKTTSAIAHETDRCTRGSSGLNAIRRLSPAPLQTQPQCAPSFKHYVSIHVPQNTGHLQPGPETDGEDIYHIPRSMGGCSTPSFPMATKYYPLSIPVVPYTGYTAVTIPSSQPQLPEDPGAFSPESQHERVSTVRTAMALPSSPVCPNLHHTSFSTDEEKLPPPAKSDEGSLTLGGVTQKRVSAKFVQDSSQFWYKPDISRDQAIAVLKGKEPGAFLIRDSNSFQGAYGLALKVATPPPNASSPSGKGDLQEQLVRHFLIEKSSQGVKIRGCPNEPHFGSLSSLVYQHSIMPISLPCILRIPESDPITDIQDLHTANIVCTAAELLKQGAACSVLYLNSVETESLTGPQAVSKAASSTLSQDPRPSAIMVHFKVSAQGITLTDRERRLFFRRHYHVNSVTFSSIDPQDRRWTSADRSNAKMFGFVAKKTGSTSENVCHLFAELEAEQPATAIVNFINKVLLGLQRR